MIAVDTSTLIAFNAGFWGIDVERLSEALEAGMLVLPPTTLSEMLSDPRLPKAIETQLLRIPVLEIHDGYWERVGHLRRKYLAKRRKARLADAQIAQSCLDHKVPLIARDRDFQKYQDASGLKLILGP